MGYEVVDELVNLEIEQTQDLLDHLNPLPGHRIRLISFIEAERKLRASGGATIHGASSHRSVASTDAVDLDASYRSPPTATHPNRTVRSAGTRMGSAALRSPPPSAGGYQETIQETAAAMPATPRRPQRSPSGGVTVTRPSSSAILSPPPKGSSWRPHKESVWLITNGSRSARPPVQGGPHVPGACRERAHARGAQPPSKGAAAVKLDDVMAKLTRIEDTLAALALSPGGRGGLSILQPPPLPLLSPPPLPLLLPSLVKGSPKAASERAAFNDEMANAVRRFSSGDLKLRKTPPRVNKMARPISPLRFHSPLEASFDETISEAMKKVLS